jgi:hypothetical protein
MKSSVSSQLLLVRCSEATFVVWARRSEYRVDSLNDLTARPIPTAMFNMEVAS